MHIEICSQIFIGNLRRLVHLPGSYQTPVCMKCKVIILMRSSFEVIQPLTKVGFICDPAIDGG